MRKLVKRNSIMKAACMEPQNDGDGLSDSLRNDDKKKAFWVQVRQFERLFRNRKQRANLVQRGILEAFGITCSFDLTQAHWWSSFHCNFLSHPLSSNDVTAVSCGSEHIAALTSTGAVWTWGRNDHGQLGHGSITPYPGIVTPERVDLGNGVVQVACGSHHCIVLGAEGEIFTWGLGDDGQLGSGCWESMPRPCRVVQVCFQPA